jgi:hypothetical protein
MQIRQFTSTGRPAIILHPRETIVTVRDLEARANRLAHCFGQPA